MKSIDRKSASEDEEYGEDSEGSYMVELPC
jgi:hypothetical protein